MYQTVEPGNIPEVLKNQPRWLVWDRVQSPGGRPTKRPRGSTREPSAWSAFDALDPIAFGGSPADHGAGFVLTGGVDVGSGWHLFALDLDGCREPTTGALAPWAAEVMRGVATYAEVSPSGTGVRLFGLHSGPIPATHVAPVPAPVLAGDHRRAEIQIFGAGSASYVTVTGWAITNESNELNLVTDCSDSFKWLVQRYPELTAVPSIDSTPEPIGRVPTLPELDHEVRTRATERERRLIRGDWESLGMPSASEGWFALLRLVLNACAGHLEVACEYLIEHTAYGQGDVESKDPTRYGDTGWVLADLARVAAKKSAAAAGVFTELPVQATDGIPAGGNQRTHFDRILAPVAITDSAGSAVTEPPRPDDTGTQAFRSGLWMTQATHEVVWLVDGVIEQNTVGMLYGHPGAFKSFLALDIGLHVATGKTWHGKRVTAGPVFYIAGEGHGGIGRRMQAWCKRRHPEGLQGVPIWSTIYRAQFVTRSGEQFVDIVEQMKTLAQQAQKMPALIIVDTMNRNFGEGSENDSETVTAFFDRCDQLRQVFPGSAVLVLHHLGKKGATARGSSVIGATVDMEMRIEREGDPTDTARPNFSEVGFSKMKDAEQPVPFWINLIGVKVGETRDGKPITSLAIDEITNQKPGPVGHFKPEQLRSSVVAVLRILGQQSRAKTALVAALIPVFSRDRSRELISDCLTQGLVRQKGAGRASRFELTEDGLKLLQAADAQQHDGPAQVFAPLTDDEQTQLDELLGERTS